VRVADQLWRMECREGGLIFYWASWRSVWLVLTIWVLFICLFIYLFIFWFFDLFIYLFIYLLIYVFMYLFIYSCIYLFIYLFIYLLIYLIIYLIIHSFIYLFIYSFIHFPSHFLSYSHSQKITGWFSLLHAPRPTPDPPTKQHCWGKCLHFQLSSKNELQQHRRRPPNPASPLRLLPVPHPHPLPRPLPLCRTHPTTPHQNKHRPLLPPPPAPPLPPSLPSLPPCHRHCSCSLKSSEERIVVDFEGGSAFPLPPSLPPSLPPGG